ncbi:LuxR C-terminal-related transcriptional regulator [Sporichthya sp.]|uniref:LuxR C-terminal-related transcriptional regulator n=1 Tax=Sporichthya sp. TaxID=65475 RepID=UPI0017C1C900|nr:LuxR C-terminal-related transcriptional regulator [Sporichthya sp.]MBA3742833.1 GAF domain-containing protein [Sporichthya sp.]
MRARDPGAPWPGRGYLLPAGRRDQLQSLLGQIAEVTGRDDLWDPSLVVDYAAAHDVLAAGWELTLGALSTLGTEGRLASGSDLDGLIDLMRTLKAFDDGIRDERLHQRDAALARVREALAALRRIDATATLVNEAAVAVCSLGFDRAIVSRIDHGRWLPETVYVGRDARWAEEILAAGRENPVVLDDTVPEWEMVRRGTALLVSDVQGDTGVNRPIAESSLSRSYVAAPIVAHGSVVGFLHADCYYQKRNLDETDREVLAAFGEGLGYALARSAVLDRLGAVRLDLGNLVNGVSTAMPVADWSLHRPLDPPADPLASNGHAFLQTFLAPGEHGGAALTRREVEVLRRMAEGDTNARIARRLVISEGTVKTHVKHILRKLGASNRAEAVSRWVQLERHQRIPGD